ncbi:MAG: HlyD family type I secretion periplasmic adaptor subunit [Nitrosomonadales bacterium]|nr:HlyD family type I secretion periplasmic adaptor subunit [Nitrosomonadales bacterium]
MKNRLPEVDPLDFSPPLLRIQEQPPRPFAGMLLYILLVLLGFIILWGVFGRLDVVATAEGKLLPQSYLKIVQPSEQGVIREILVSEGEAVKAGQILMRMDATLSEADGRELQSDFSSKKIALRRIDAELSDQPFERRTNDDEKDYNDTLAQYRANRAAYETALSQEQSQYDKAQSDLAAAQETKTKLLQVLPHYRSQDEAYAQLAKEGYVSLLAATDKARERIEKEQDLKTQEHLIAGAEATLNQSSRKLAQITAEYRQKLQAERSDTSDKLDKVGPELAKQQYHRALHELKAPQDGIVKDLATHTPGTVISPGSILLTLVPKDETLRAEVWVSNQDVGFIHTGEPVKLKLAAYQFQKYGMIDGEVANLSADASDNNNPNGQQQPSSNKTGSSMPFAYRALVDLRSQYLEEKGVRHKLSPGMQVTAEINLGTRSIIEYLLSPVMGAFQEAGRER